MAIKAGNAILSILLQAITCTIFAIYLDPIKETVSYLYSEEGPEAAFIRVLGYFTTILFGLPVFFTNYYYTRLCFKSRPLSFGEIAMNLLLMAACNALYQIILFKVVAGERLDILAISLTGIGMASCFLMELLRYKISTPKAA